MAEDVAALVRTDGLVDRARKGLGCDEANQLDEIERVAGQFNAAIQKVLGRTA